MNTLWRGQRRPILGATMCEVEKDGGVRVEPEYCLVNGVVFVAKQDGKFWIPASEVRPGQVPQYKAPSPPQKPALASAGLVS